MGIIQYAGTTIDAGAGQIKMDGRTTGTSGSINSHAIELGFGGSASTLITSSRSSDTAIDINGATSGTSTDSKGVNFWSGSATSFVKIYASGAAGNVKISGSASTSTMPGLSINWARILSKGGTVTLDSGSNPTAFGNSSSSSVVYLGADTSGGATGNIDINAGSLTWAGTVNARTTGDLTIDSGSAQSFASGVTIASSLSLAEIANVRIGTAGTSAATQNTANVTLAGALASAGNVRVYGGDIAANANVTGTGLDGQILLKATGSISQAVSTALRTNSGKIVLWSDADETNGGNVIVKGSICSAPTATTCDANATSGGDDVVIGGGAASVSDTSVPGGYSTGAATTDYNS
jgi:hypothetical protein